MLRASLTTDLGKFLSGMLLEYDTAAERCGKAAQIFYLAWGSQRHWLLGSSHAGP